MTIDEAIEDLKEQEAYALRRGWYKKAQAIHIGIEALNRLRTLRQDPRLSVALPLPSETEYDQH